MPHEIVDTGLPVEASIPELHAALAAPGHAVLVAPPGSGKTTVVPLRLLDAGWRVGRKVVVLEPRRLATRAAARRMADLLGEAVGETVGYVTRDDRRTGRTTVIEVVTEGVLTRRIQRDPELPDTAIVLFDEFHERNLQTDLGLALTLDVRRHLRPDLRILAMSATIDAGRLADVLGNGTPAPVVRSEAREHPVEIRWVPLPRRARIEPHVASVVARAVRDEAGDMLVFLPGMGEMLRVRDRLAELEVAADIRLLHGSLPADEQDAALRPSPPGGRKVVLATDIAETSLTVEGVRLVVDSGLARAPRYDARTGMTRLQTISISRASADQRAGRAGRTEPGIAYRLWSKLEHGARERHIRPEITQVDLAGLVLELATWGATDAAGLDFLDAPPARSVLEARRLLEMLEAIDEEGRLTATGRAMAGLPVHPRLARMVIDAGADRWLACLVAALVDGRDVLRGHPDELPVDVAVRTRVLSGDLRHPAASARTIARIGRDATDIARRAGVTPSSEVDHHHAGNILALAYPDRLAIRRGSPGRFQLRTGTTAWIRDTDPLAVARFMIACDLDGKRKDARIRLAAALEPDEVAEHFAADVTVRASLEWNEDRLVLRTERRIGGLVLDTNERRPDAGAETAAALRDRLTRSGLADLGWTKAAAALRDRLQFLHDQYPDEWPDVSTPGLIARLDTWLGADLATATGLDDLAAIDLVPRLRASIPPRSAGSLDRLAPSHLEIGGRRVAVDYTTGTPVVAVRVQALFGTKRTPEIGGRPVTLELLSPAGRPVQITSDLAGFWTGSWKEVRKEMAGRYPKHSWPDDPVNARPDVK